MKKSYFIIFFMIVAFLFVYAQPITPIVTSQDVSNPSKETNASFYYEGQLTSSWKFVFENDAVGLKISDLDENNEQISKNVELTKYLGSTSNCEYYSFRFGRQAKILTYELPLDGDEPIQTEEGVFCRYSIDPITQDLNKILSLGGRALDPNNICSSNQQKQLESGTSECPETQICEVAINTGATENYGFLIQKDSAENIYVQEDNSGNLISLNNISSNAQTMINLCIQGPKAGTRSLFIQDDTRTDTTLSDQIYITPSSNEPGYCLDESSETEQNTEYTQQRCSLFALYQGSNYVPSQSPPGRRPIDSSCSCEDRKPNSENDCASAPGCDSGKVCKFLPEIKNFQGEILRKKQCVCAECTIEGEIKPVWNIYPNDPDVKILPKNAQCDTHCQKTTRKCVNGAWAIEYCAKETECGMKCEIPEEALKNINKDYCKQSYDKSLTVYKCTADHQCIPSGRTFGSSCTLAEGNLCYKGDCVIPSGSSQRDPRSCEGSALIGHCQRSNSGTTPFECARGFESCQATEGTTCGYSLCDRDCKEKTEYLCNDNNECKVVQGTATCVNGDFSTISDQEGLKKMCCQENPNAPLTPSC